MAEAPPQPGAAALKKLEFSIVSLTIDYKSDQGQKLMIKGDEICYPHMTKIMIQ